MNWFYVPSRLFKGLAALGVGHARTPSVAGQIGGGQTFRISSRLRETKRHLHEDPFCECRPCSCVDRFADKFKHRRIDAIAERQFVALGEREQFSFWEIWLGTRLRRFFGFRIGRCGSVRLHRRTGRTSSETEFYRRIEIICGTIWLGMAERLKPFKRFQHSSNPALYLAEARC
jgi:hypothetical protein